MTKLFPTPDLLDWRIHTHTHTHTHIYIYIYIYIYMTPSTSVFDITINHLMVSLQILRLGECEEPFIVISLSSSLTQSGNPFLPLFLSLKQAQLWLLSRRKMFLFQFFLLLVWLKRTQSSFCWMWNSCNHIFHKVSALWERQIASSQVWRQITKSIYYVDNPFTKSASAKATLSLCAWQSKAL